MKPQRIVNVRDKLPEIGVPLDSLSLGDFDWIAQPTAMKVRQPGSELWRSVGAYYKPNLERGLLIYSLIKKFNLSSYLEIGFGRGYSAICAAKAFAELGNDGKVMVIEPNVDDEFMHAISNVFPQEWLSRIQIARGNSEDILPQLQDKYDLVYVDGDHTASAVRSDWEGCKDLWDCFLLMDDYHMDYGTDPGIQVNEALDEVDQPEGTECELIVSDRRIFVDDRGWPDEKVRYGQLLLTRPSKLEDRGKEVAFKETWDW